MTLPKKSSFLRVSLFLLTVTVVANVSALEITKAMFQGRDFRPSKYGNGVGYAEFAVHDYKLTQAMVYTVNYGLAGLIKSHQQVFKRQVGRNFRVRFRIFGKFEDYAEYSRVRYEKEVSKNLLGFFSPTTNEIVSWKQEPHLTWRLVPTLLHEGCHTIMDEMFGVLPFWMVEGSADWLGEAPAWLQKADGLRNDQHYRWVRLDRMRQSGKLPNLKIYLHSSSYEEWDRMFDGNIGLGYDIGWSIFDFFIKADPKGQAMRFLGGVINDPKVQRARGRSGQMELEFSRAIDRRWQGGTTLLEKGWHTWIKTNAKNAEKELLKARRNRQ